MTENLSLKSFWVHLRFTFYNQAPESIICSLYIDKDRADDQAL